MGGGSNKLTQRWYTLGIQSLDRRMVSWNLNTMRFVSVIGHPNDLRIWRLISRDRNHLGHEGNLEISQKIPKYQACHLLKRLVDMNLETCLSDVDLEKSEVFFFHFCMAKMHHLKSNMELSPVFFPHEGNDYVIHTVHTHKQEID